MPRILLLAVISFAALAGGLQKLEDLPQTVDELFAKKDTRRLKKRGVIQTVDGKKIRGDFVRFAGDMLIPHVTPTR